MAATRRTGTTVCADEAEARDETPSRHAMLVAAR
jgi:hypothetical protein